MEQHTKIFISYAHEDEALLEQLEKHLASLRQQKLISTWYDRNISAGKEWAHEIDVHLKEAEIILLLISADFLASDYCYSIEMKRALERHKAGETCVIPIILRPVDWEGAPFSYIQPLPTDAVPIDDRRWHNRDEAFVNVVKGIRKTLRELSTKRLTESEVLHKQTIPKERYAELRASINEIIAGYRAKEDILVNIMRNRTPPAVIVLGTATVGKSSLINALFGGQLVTAVSPFPQESERTEELLWAGALKLVDSPSYDQSPQEALKQLALADIVIQVYDMSMRRIDAQLANLIQKSGKPCIMVLNKIDLYSHDKQAGLIDLAKRGWSLDALSVSAKKREGLVELVQAICQALPKEVSTDVLAQITAQGGRMLVNRLQKEKVKSRKDACQEIIEEISEEAAQIEIRKMIEVDLFPLLILYRLMVRLIAKQYLEEIVLNKPVKPLRETL